ncbi:MAG: tripartite tricarboxylate transporter TctB family protein [Syntrophaceae bacterium]|nr:tripartite tricarboxylate transporter TctB family protein [Syntrophaceae bacterium]
MRWNQSRLLAVTFVVLCIAYYLQIRKVIQFSFGGDLIGPKWFPTSLSVIGILFSILLWFEKDELKLTKSENYFNSHLIQAKKSFTSKIAKEIYAFAVYVLILPYTGFIVSTILLLTIFVKLAGETRLWVCLSAGIIMTLSVYFCFLYFLEVHLPSGTWIMMLN